MIESEIKIKSEEELRPQVEAVFEQIIKQLEVKEALDLLDKLPENLRYHNKDHTFDVLKETILFCLADGVSDSVLRQQCVAAAWHDVGYIKQYQANEPVAVDLFKSSLAYSILSPEQRAEVEANILDTQMVMVGGAPSLLQNRSEDAYILDADVSNFGRDDYFDKRLKVAEEIGLDLNDIEKKKKFFKFALDLMTHHEWKTEAARNLREAKKQENVALITKELAELK